MYLNAARTDIIAPPVAAHIEAHTTTILTLGVCAPSANGERVIVVEQSVSPRYRGGPAVASYKLSRPRNSCSSHQASRRGVLAPADDATLLLPHSLAANVQGKLEPPNASTASIASYAESRRRPDSQSLDHHARADADLDVAVRLAPLTCSNP